MVGLYARNRDEVPSQSIDVMNSIAQKLGIDSTASSNTTLVLEAVIFKQMFNLFRKFRNVCWHFLHYRCVPRQLAV